MHVMPTDVRVVSAAGDFACLHCFENVVQITRMAPPSLDDAGDEFHSLDDVEVRRAPLPLPRFAGYDELLFIRR